MSRRSQVLVLVLATALLAVAAYWLLFTTFMSHDDEGYVLISLKNYVEHGGLYDQVYSQYGPFPYVVHDAAHRLLGYSFSNATGRWITLLCWIGSSAACGGLVWQQTRRFSLTTFTLALTFFHLWLMVGEPIHPGGLITLLVAGAALGGAYCIHTRSPQALAILAGAVGTALALTKINVGCFFILAAGAWFVAQLSDRQHRRLGIGLMTFLLAALAPTLMGRALHDEWAWTFASAATIASLTMLATAYHERENLTHWRHAMVGGSAMVILGALILGLVIGRGSSLPVLLDGIILGPLRHPGIYHYPPTWHPGTSVVTILSPLLAIGWLRRRSVPLATLIIALRFGFALWLALASLELTPFTSHSSVMSYGLPLAWIYAVRLGSGTGTDPRVATWIGLLLVLQYLHAFPVAGSQVAWGTFLFIPLVALGIHDALSWMETRAWRRVTALMVWAAGSFAVACGGHLGRIGWEHYRDSAPLDLPGAESLRPPDDLASTLRIVSMNAVAHGDMLFSLPGMYSFNLWTELPSPTLRNTTHWFSLLTSDQQKEIADALERSKRPVVLVHRLLLDLLEESKFVVASPLHDYLDTHFERTFRLGTYEFWVRRGRKIAPLCAAEFLKLASPQPGLPAYKLEIVAPLSPGTRISSIEIASLASPQTILLRYDHRTGPLTATPINLDGTPLGGELDSKWDQILPPLVKLSLPLDQVTIPPLNTSVVRLRDAQGALVTEARFMQ